MPFHGEEENWRKKLKPNFQVRRMTAMDPNKKRVEEENNKKDEDKKKKDEDKKKKDEKK